MKSLNYRFTVFTATYNRAKTLPRVYESLLKQTFENFEWLIIDDGSEDYTRELVEKWIEEKRINIRYFHKENGGKHTAWSVGVERAESEYLVCLDSDDEALPECLSIFNKHWTSIEALDEAEQFWEVKALCLKPDGSINGKGAFPKAVYDSFYQEVVYKRGIMGDQIGCRRVSVLRGEAAVPQTFIYHEMCNNMPESIRWARAGKRYKSRYVNDVVFQIHYDGGGSLCRSVNLKRSKESLYAGLVASFYLPDENYEYYAKYQKIQLIRRAVIALLNLNATGESLSDYCDGLQNQHYKRLILSLSPLTPLISVFVKLLRL